LGGPPKCRAGEPEGTVVEAFPLGGTEGTFARQDDVDLGLQFLAHSLDGIYYPTPSAVEEPYWPSGEVALLFQREADDTMNPVEVRVSDGRIVRIDFLEAPSIEGFLGALSDEQIILSEEAARAWAQGLQE
jgi:hypothetical protein